MSLSFLPLALCCAVQRCPSSVSANSVAKMKSLCLLLLAFLSVAGQAHRLWQPELSGEELELAKRQTSDTAVYPPHYFEQLVRLRPISCPAS